MPTKARTYTQFRDAIRTVIALGTVGSFPQQWQKTITSLTDMQGAFEKDGKAWMKGTAEPAAAAKSAKKKKKAAKTAATA